MKLRTVLFLFAILLAFPKFGYATDPTATPTANRATDRCDCNGFCTLPMSGTCGACYLIRNAVCSGDAAATYTATPLPRSTRTPRPSVTVGTPAPTRTPQSTRTATGTPTANSHDRCDCDGLCTRPVNGKCGDCVLVHDAICIGAAAATYTPGNTYTPTRTRTPTLTPTSTRTPTSTPTRTATNTPA